MNAQYGYKILRPEMLVEVTSPPPPSAFELVAKRLWRIARNIVYVLAGIAALVLGTLVLAVTGLSSLSVVYGLVVGAFTYLAVSRP